MLKINNAAALKVLKYFEVLPAARRVMDSLK